MNDKTLLIAAVSLLVGGFLLIVIAGQAQIAGKVVQEDAPEEDSSDNVNEVYVCSSGTCNPESAREICIDGKWSACPSEQVCVRGSCTVPKSGGSSTPFVSSSGSSGSSVVTTSSIGEIEGSKTLEVGEEIIKFNMNGESYTLQINNIETTSASLGLNGIDAILNVGEEKGFDGNGDNTNEIKIKLKSVNLVKNKISLIVTEASA